MEQFSSRESCWNTTHFQTPDPLSSLTYCSGGGAEGARGNLFTLSLQTALCTVCGEKSNGIHSQHSTCCSMACSPPGQATLTCMISLRYTVEKVCMIYNLVLYTPHLSPFLEKNSAFLLGRKTISY